MSLVSFDLSIKGMKCTSCSNKIEGKLASFPAIKKTSVNFLLEKVSISISPELLDTTSQTPDELVDIIKTEITNLGFNVIKVTQINHDSSNLRKMNLRTKEANVVKSLLDRYVGITKIVVESNNSSSKKNSSVISNQGFGDYNNLVENPSLINHVEENLVVTYNPTITKASEIVDYLDNNNINFRYFNDIENIISEITSVKEEFTFKHFVICMILTLISITLSMLLVESPIEDFLVNIKIVFDKLNLHLVLCSVINLIIIYYFGLVIYKRAFISFYYSFSTGMDSLIALGSLSALLLSSLILIEYLFFIDNSNPIEINETSIKITKSLSASSIVIGISTLGKFVEDNAKTKIRKQSTSFINQDKTEINQKIMLFKPLNKELSRYNEVFINQGLLEVNDLVKLNNNDFILLDSIIIKGEVEVNEGINQGYDIITVKKPGEKLKSGTIITKVLNTLYNNSSDSNKEDFCLVTVENVLEKSMMFKLMDSMLASLNQKLKFQHFVDKITEYFVPIIVLIVFFSFFVWSIRKFSGYQLVNDRELTWFYIFERCISILVVSCPCAFGLAIPTVTTIAMSKAMKLGILIKNLTILPEIRKTNKIAFDKTGTLTETIKNINSEFVEEKYPVYEIIECMEMNQTHPVGESLYYYALKNKAFISKDKLSVVKIIDDDEFKSNEDRKSIIKHDYGIEANVIVNNNTEYNIIIGSTTVLDLNSNIKTSDKEKIIMNNIKKNNKSITLVIVNNAIASILSIDTVTNMRAEAKGVINYMRDELSIESYILSGDAEDSVNTMARELNISSNNTFGALQPGRKKIILNELKQNDNKVMMIGDGVNDVLSLSEASFGVSFNATSHLNLISSDIIIVKEDLSLLIALINISHFSFYFIWVNIFWAFGYNFLMIPISSGLFEKYINIEISPQLSSFFMLLSSLLIIFNSNLLRFISFNSYKVEGDYVNTLKTRIELENTSNNLIVVDEYKALDDCCVRKGSIDKNFNSLNFDTDNALNNKLISSNTSNNNNINSFEDTRDIGNSSIKTGCCSMKNNNKENSQLFNTNNTDIIDDESNKEVKNQESCCSKNNNTNDNITKDEAKENNNKGGCCGTKKETIENKIDLKETKKEGCCGGK